MGLLLEHLLGTAADERQALRCQEAGRKPKQTCPSLPCQA